MVVAYPVMPIPGSHELVQQDDGGVILQVKTMADDLLCFEDCAICGILHTLQMCTNDHIAPC